MPEQAKIAQHRLRVLNQHALENVKRKWLAWLGLRPPKDESVPINVAVRNRQISSLQKGISLTK